MTFTKNEALKEIRKTARDNGMTFKAINARLNGGQLYGLFNRKTGEKLVDNYQLWTAYEDVQNGYFKSLADKYGTKIITSLDFEETIAAFKECLSECGNTHQAATLAFKKYGINAADSDGGVTSDHAAWYKALNV